MTKHCHTWSTWTTRSTKQVDILILVPPPPHLLYIMYAACISYKIHSTSQCCRYSSIRQLTCTHILKVAWLHTTDLNRKEQHTHKLDGYLDKIRRAFGVPSDSPKTKQTARHLHVRITALSLSNALSGSLTFTVHCAVAKPSSAKS